MEALKIKHQFQPGDPVIYDFNDKHNYRRGPDGKWHSVNVCRPKEATFIAYGKTTFCKIRFEGKFGPVVKNVPINRVGAP